MTSTQRSPLYRPHQRKFAAGPANGAVSLPTRRFFMHAAVSSVPTLWPTQGLRAAPVSAYVSTPLWRGTTVQRNESGCNEAFSIGPDGLLWSYTLDEAHDACGRLKCLGLPAERFALGRWDGLTVVLAVSGGELRYVAETGSQFGSRWSPVQAVKVPSAMQGAPILAVFARKLDQSLFFGVVTQGALSQGKPFMRLWEAVWASGGLVFCNTPVKPEVQYSIWNEEFASVYGDPA